MTSARDTLYRKLLDNLSTATLLLSPDGQVRYLNPAAEALLETSLQRCLDQPINNLFRHGSGPEERIGDMITGTVHDHQPITRRQASLVLSAGQHITVDLSVTPVDDGTTVVVEMLPLDRLLRISREETLITAQKTTQMLVRGLAHEIKNPLGGIRGAAQLLDRELTDEHLHEYTRVIIEEADRLRNLVDRLLGPHKPGVRSRINVHEITEHIRKLLDAESGNSIRIVRDYDPSIPEFIADREGLIQALLNIARNAMEALRQAHTPRGEIRLSTRIMRQFTLGTQRHALVCRIDISDNGPGVPAELRDRIFFPMVTGRADGTGLGLSIAQSIVQQHNGLIECASEPGHTCFSVYLPLENTHDA
ncbi:MAG: nitrogen regulation protein NR(II) [Gammaproteobacteria bacterium]|nr:MAG: nitrogen regulation protein NR(II) [Gammaproteobacteria bacterium]